MLQGLITAIPTPFDKYGIDYSSVSKLVQFQIKNKVDGLVVIGSTGEGSSLSIAEQIALVEYVVTEVSGRVKIIVGVPHNSLESIESFIGIFNRIKGVDYLMIATPPYIKPNQDGIYQYFKHMSLISNLPIILYNVPGRTACDLANDTVIRLANECNNIVGLKDATGDIKRLCYLNKYKPNGFSLLSGDDETSMAFVLSGGNGVISVTSNIKPLEMSQMIKSAIISENKTAIEFNNRLLKLYEVMFVESNPIPIKWALYYKNIIEFPYLRMPLVELNPQYHEQVKTYLDLF